VSEALALVVPAELVEALAERVAELLRDQPRQEPTSPWLDVDGACAYLGFSRNTLYKLTAARAIPSRKKADGQGLRFHRDELDAWMEEQYPRLDRLG
jgi:excisionase family DNA binding protein